jgi:DNA-binding MarR family transcriptional regulator
MENFDMAVKEKRRQQQQDHVDRWLEEAHEFWGLPHLDKAVEGIVNRINGLNRRFKRTLEETLSEHGLSHGEWDVLGQLARSGPPYRRSAGQLAQRCDCSSGAMTNRLDQLESRGLVRRLRDPSDRRGVLVELTPKGRKTWDASVDAQAEKEALLAAALTAREKEQLNALLRRLMLEFERREAQGTEKE